jgi:hypothetical protein
MKTYPLLSGEGLEVRSGQFLKAAAISAEKAVDMRKLAKNKSKSRCLLQALEGWKVGRTIM